MLQSGCGIYRPVLTEGPDATLQRRFVLPPKSEDGALSQTDAAHPEDGVCTVGVDCCGLLVD